MHLVSHSNQVDTKSSPYAGLAFSLAIADAEEIAALRQAGRGRITLAAPYHMSEDDAYLVVPEDIGLEIIDILRDGDHELLQETLRDGLLVLGQLERGEQGMQLLAEACATPAATLASIHHAEHVELDGSDLVRRINQLGHLQCTTLSAMVDDDGIENILREEEYVGASWTLEATLAKRLGHVEPTYVWSRRERNGTISVELALFSEDDEIVVLLRPLQIVV